MIKKKCTKCGEIKSTRKFYKHRITKDNVRNECKACTRQRNKEYLHSKGGLICQIYSNQLKSSKKRKHPTPTYTKQELKNWLFSQDKFHELFNGWAKSGFDKMLAPSCDRIDNCNGYSLDRLELKIWKENKEKAYLDRKNGSLITTQNKAILQFTKDNVFIKEFYSMHQAERETNIRISNISNCCKKHKHYSHAGGYRWECKNNV